MAKPNKLTYAEIAEKLTQSYNKYDKQLQGAVTEAEKKFSYSYAKTCIRQY